MNEGRLLGPIYPDEMLVKSLAYSSSVANGSCYVILTRTDFGWHPALVPLPFSYPNQYYLIPLDRVQYVRLTSYGLPRHEFMKIYYNDALNNLEVFDCRLWLARGWLRLFRRVGIPIVGADCVDPWTLRGFVNGYGYGIWMLLYLLIGVFVIFLMLRGVFHQYQILITSTFATGGGLTLCIGSA